MFDTDFAKVRHLTDAVMARATAFTHPDDVLNDRHLSVSQKRTILAAWASDAHAVPNRPAVRQIGSGAIVDIDTVLTALRALDGRAQAGSVWPRAGLRKPELPFKARWHRSARPGFDDDDDPPPCPAAALPPGVEVALRRRRQEDLGLAAA
jgi:hypothetical protein